MVNASASVYRPRQWKRSRMFLNINKTAMKQALLAMNERVNLLTNITLYRKDGKGGCTPTPLLKPQDDHEHSSSRTSGKEARAENRWHMIIENTYKSEIQIRMRVVRLAEELQSTRCANQSAPLRRRSS